MNQKVLNKVYEVIAYLFGLLCWFGLLPSMVFNIESTGVVVGFLLISSIGTVQIGYRIYKAIIKIGEIKNETND